MVLLLFLKLDNTKKICKLFPNSRGRQNHLYEKICCLFSLPDACPIKSALYCICLAHVFLGSTQTVPLNKVESKAFLVSPALVEIYYIFFFLLLHFLYALHYSECLQWILFYQEKNVNKISTAWIFSYSLCIPLLRQCYEIFYRPPLAGLH